jgi:hypothetical protein
MDGLRDELKRVMEQRGLSQRAVSKMLGISSSTLSQWISDKYPGDAAQVDAAVESFLQLHKQRSKAPRRPIVFVETSAAAKGLEVCELCHQDQEIGVLFGEAGYGKTVLIKEYCKRYPDVILIEADLGFCARMLFLELAKKLGLDGAGVIHNIFDDCVGKLRNSGRLLIIDEAELLPYRALELLRRLHDKAGIGILLVGMPRLISNLRGRQGEYAQLYSRVGIAAKLEMLSESDTKKLVDAVLPQADGLYRTFHEESKANARTLQKLLNRSVRVAAINGIDVNHDVIRAAAETLII